MCGIMHCRDITHKTQHGLSSVGASMWGTQIRGKKIGCWGKDQLAKLTRISSAIFRACSTQAPMAGPRR